MPEQQPVSLLMMPSTVPSMGWPMMEDISSFKFHPVKPDITDDILSPIPLDVDVELSIILDQDDISCVSDALASKGDCDVPDWTESSVSDGSRSFSKEPEVVSSSSSMSSASNTTPDGNRFKHFHEEKWNVRYKELLIFRKENGHAAVPHSYPKNPQLSRWVKRQRRQWKLLQENQTSTMTTERLSLLNEIGFVWDSHDVNWREKLDALLSFRHENGHCNVPSNNKDKKLATWVKCQRRQYKLFWDGKPSSMTSERILQLEQAGFEWEIRASSPRKKQGTGSPMKE